LLHLCLSGMVGCRGRTEGPGLPDCKQCDGCGDEANAPGTRRSSEESGQTLDDRGEQLRLELLRKLDRPLRLWLLDGRTAALAAEAGRA
jgi:hypothetical protein